MNCTKGESNAIQDRTTERNSLLTYRQLTHATKAARSTLLHLQSPHSFALVLEEGQMQRVQARAVGVRATRSRMMMVDAQQSHFPM